MKFIDVDLFFTQGLDGGTDDKLAQGPLVLENAEWIFEGSLSKRRGYELLATGVLNRATGSAGQIAGDRDVSVLPPVTTLMTRESRDGQELVAVTSSSIAHYIPNSNIWSSVGEARACEIAVQRVVPAGSKYFCVSSAHLSGVRAIAWCEDTVTDTYPYQAKAMLQDVTTGEIITPPFGLTAKFSNTTNGGAVHDVSVQAFGNYLWIFAFGPDTYTASKGEVRGYILYRKIDPNRPWNVSQGDFIDSRVIAGLPHTLDTYAWTSNSTLGSCLAVGYITGSSIQPRVQVKYLNTAGTVLATKAARPNIRYFQGLECTSAAHILYVSGNHEQHIMVGEDENGDLFTDSAGSTHHLSGNWIDASGSYGIYAVMSGSRTTNVGDVDIFVEYYGRQVDADNFSINDSLRFSRIQRWNLNADVTTIFGFPAIRTITSSSLGTVFRHCQLASRPFKRGNKTLLNLCHISDEQAVHFLADTDRGVWAAYNVGEASYPSINHDRVKPGSTPDTYECMVQTRGRLEAVNGTPQFNIQMARVNMDFEPEPAAWVPVGETLVRGGGQLRHYDGVRDVELGYLYYPELKTWPDGGFVADTWPSFVTGSGTIPAGVYQYYATYRWLDAQGKEHRSAPGSAATLTTTASCGITVNVPTMTFTDRIKYEPEVILTPTGSDIMIDLWRTENAGTVAYKINPTGTLNNPLDSNYVSFVDCMTDADLIGNEALYFPAELPNTYPPPGRCVTVWGNRLWSVSSADGLLLSFSKTLTSDLGPEHSDELVLGCDPAGGRIVALAPLDSVLVAFKSDRIFIVYGDGPLNDGTGGSFAGPELLTSEVGCVDPRSVVIMPGRGVMFRSQRGIYVLGHDRSIQLVGDAVSDIDSVDNTGAVALSDLHQVRLSRVDNTELVLDTQYGRWTTVSSSLSHAASTLWRDRHVIGGISGSTGGVWATLSGSFLDASSSYAMVLQTPWITPAGPQGEARVREVDILGTFRSNHVLNLKVEYDYTPSGSVEPCGFARAYTTGVAASEFSNSLSGSLYQLTHRLHHERCESVRFTLSDTQQSSSYGSMTLEGIRIRGASREGARRLPRYRRQG